MKIDSALKNVTAPQSKRKADKTKAGDQGPDKAGVKDNVDLTSQSTLMQSLEHSLSNMPDADTTKVEEIRQAIAEGRFKVNEEVVAERLVEDSMEHLQHASKNP